jgi:methyltransferase (TIGR00027 family)
MRVAIRRAAHQVLDTPRVLDDPIALRIIGDERADAIRQSPWKHQAPASRAARAFFVARSRFAEDELGRAAARGVAQYVILGAGLDTFAYRHAYPPGSLRLFEVDHPATQVWKRARLSAAGIAIPPSLTYAAVDFERQTLADGLTRAGFDRQAPAFFSWLGVTMYLSGEAFRSTLAFVASTGRGGGLVFDYAVPRESLGLIGRIALDAIAFRVASVGEPFRTFFDPRSLRAELRQAGFGSMTDLGRDELNARYFADRTDGLHVSGELGRVIVATLDGNIACRLPRPEFQGDGGAADAIDRNPLPGRAGFSVESCVSRGVYRASS